MVAERSAQVVVASNRGPVSYTPAEDGSLTARRGGGGLVTGLSATGSETEAVWVCAALNDGDRQAARRAGRRLDADDTGGQAVRMLDIPAEVFATAYNDIANSVLWFVHHLLYDTPREPAFDTDFAERWTAFEAYNAAFADALAEEAAEGAAVLVQDYHLVLVPALLRTRRPDLRISHFSHTPWAPPDYYGLLPDDVAADVLRGVLGADRAGFLTRRWARAFADCCVNVLGARVSLEGDAADLGGGATPEEGELWVTHDGHTTRLGIHPLSPDGEFLRERSRRGDVTERQQQLRAQIGGGDRRIIVRVDRTEPSKNIVRGLRAFRRLLTDHAEWRGRVVQLAFAYPSRQDLTVYQEYTAEVARVAEGINADFGTPAWTPVVLHVEDDFARSLAAYRMADVALVNPIRDGMNLVAKEVPVVCDDGCALVLSREAGAADELGEDALTVNPYDVAATADALHAGLSMPPEERAERSRRLATAATALPPAAWFLAQLEALRAT